MNAETPNPRSDWEAKLTARLLGELPSEEAAALAQAIAQDPELARLEERLRRTVDWVREVEQEPATPSEPTTSLPRLTAGKREAMLARLRQGTRAGPPEPAPTGSTIGTTIPVAFPSEDSSRVGSGAWLAIAACLVGLLASFSLWQFGPASGSAGNEVRQLSFRAISPDEVAAFSTGTLEARPERRQLALSTKPGSEPETKLETAMGRGAVESARRYGLSPAEPALVNAPAAMDAEKVNSLPALSKQVAEPVPPVVDRSGVVVESLADRPVEVAAAGDVAFSVPMDARAMVADFGRPSLGQAPQLGTAFRMVEGGEKGVNQGVTPPLPATVAPGAPIPAAAAPTLSRQDAGLEPRQFGSLSAAVPAPVEERMTELARKRLAGVAGDGGGFGGGGAWADFDQDGPVEIQAPLGVPPSQPARGRSKAKDGVSTAAGETFEYFARDPKLTANRTARETQSESDTLDRSSAGRSQSLAEMEDLATSRGASKRTNIALVLAGKEIQPVELAERGVALGFQPSTPATAPVPQPEVRTEENAFSTFSLNVADVSFKLAAASLEAGKLPEPGAIRAEEFLNAFDYRDPEAGNAVPVTLAWERAWYPFAQQREVLRLAVRTAARGREPGVPLNLVLVLDSSGSMERADRVNIVREALRTLATQLRPEDRISVVTFARTARLQVDGLPGSQAGELMTRVGEVTPEGGTNLEDALRTGYETALKHFLPAGNNRVVMLTDGAANLGDVHAETLRMTVESYRRRGVALDCFGIGWEGYQDELLAEMSRSGDGRYGFVNSPDEAATGFAAQLAGALRVAAADVKVQVEFNPRRVTVWRQVGYARHQLAKEQFRDNTVDAAEIGAAESGNALYVLATDPRGHGPLGEVRVRYRVPSTGEYREHSWALPYSGTAMPLEQAGPALQLATVAGAFAESLAESPFASEVTCDRLLGYLRPVHEAFEPDPRPVGLESMIRQTRSIRGR